jgi:hypothetical protein
MGCAKKWRVGINHETISVGEAETYIIRIRGHSKVNFSNKKEALN